MASFNPTNDPSLVFLFDDQSPFAVNPDGTGGTPADGSPCAFWGDRSGHANHLVKLTGLPVPDFTANLFIGRPGAHLPGRGLDAAGDGPTGGRDRAGRPHPRVDDPPGGVFAPLSPPVTYRIYPTGFGTSPYGFQVYPDGRRPSGRTSGARSRSRRTRSSPSAGRSTTTWRRPRTWRRSSPSTRTGGPVRDQPRGRGRRRPAGHDRGRLRRHERGAVLVRDDLRLGVDPRKLSAAEVYQWDAYYRARAGVAWPGAAPPYYVVWDSNSLSSSPDFEMTYYAANDLGIPPEAVFNVSWPGKKTSQQVAGAAADVDPVLAVLPAGKPVVSVQWEITNDLGIGGEAAEAAEVNAYAAARKAAGFTRTVVGTCLPRANLTAFDASRLLCNADVIALVGGHRRRRRRRRTPSSARSRRRTRVRRTT